MGGSDLFGGAGSAAAIGQKGIILDAPFEVCPKCGGKFFKNVVMFKKISKIQVGAPDDILYPIPVYVCDKCGEVAPSYKEDPDFKKLLGEGDEKSSDNVEEAKIIL